MNTRLVTAVLVGSNLVLLGVAGLLYSRLRANPDPARVLTRSTTVTNVVSRIVPRKVNLLDTNLIERLARMPRTWADLEAADYVTYIYNLRRFGCPEETIRDIIIMDVSKQFARKRAELRGQARPYEFWRTDDAWGNDASDAGLAQKLRELDREERELVRHLLGVDPSAERARYALGDDYEERMYGFLPAEKRGQLQELQSKYEDMEQEVYARSRGVMLEEDQEQLRRLEKQREEELAKILTPEELEEYQLRNSSTSHNLRAQLSGFAPTEEEFRKLFRAQKDYDDLITGGFDLTDPAQVQQHAQAREQAENALAAEVKGILGEERYKQYQMAQDADHRSLVQLSERFGFGQDVAAKVYDMKVEAERQKKQLEQNASLTEEQRQAAMAALTLETEKSVAQALGGTTSKVWQAYEKLSSGWIQDLGSSVEAFANQPPPVAPQPAPMLPPLPPPLIIR